MLHALEASPVFLDVMAFVLGTAIGSFLGVVAGRLPEGLSIVQPGSHCFRCGHPIAWYDNIPLVSYLLSRGRCRWCHGRFSSGHFWIEFYTGALTWIAFRRFGLEWPLLPALAFIWMLIPISIIDFKEQIIPDVISLPGAALGFAFSWLPGGVTPLDSFTGFVAGGVILWAVATGYARLRGREGMGGGDIKLLALMGSFLGLQPMVLALFLASILGVILGGSYLVISRGGRNVHLPFGPFLAAGGVLVMLEPERLMTFYVTLLDRIVGF